MTTIAEITKFLEEIAPRSLQESYDNSGLICGNPTNVVSGVLVSLDAIESVVDEAIEKGANLIVSHHPILFYGLKSLTGANYVERTILKAIKHDIALYAIHTNLDNVLRHGVNERLAQQLELTDLTILAPDQSLIKYQIFVSELLSDDVVRGLNEILRDQIDAFSITIEATVGSIVIYGPHHIRGKVAAICSNYHLDFHSSQLTTSKRGQIGAGILGHLALPMTEDQFLAHLKSKLGLSVIRHTALRGKSIEHVALCGGAGSFLLSRAVQAGADVFVTGDYKYHEFFDADGKIVITDVGHYESEQFTINLLTDLIKGKFSNFAARCAETPTNPVFYYS